MTLQLLVILLGLVVFEIVSSIDNAIVNAHVLKTLPERFRKLFLTWGLLIAVVVMRGVLPFVIVWFSNPSLSLTQLVSFVFSGDPSIAMHIEKSKGLLLLGGGVYLVLVFLSWLFLEEKKYAFLVEHFIHRQSVWFYAFASIFFTSVVYIAIRINPALALAAAIGSTAFFITDGFKKNAEKAETSLASISMSAWSKLLYLEVLDASFSIDGVIGAFAFTISIPLILIGNGIGAFVVREFTIRGMKLVEKFAYLKNGAMYSIGMLGALMVLESFGKHYPFWLAPLNTFALLGIFLFLSYREINMEKRAVSI
ncbi:MAG: hypothetical protein A3A33_03705 [Candidatus Yanofskybacteria bacterium RIFCSPLOWO2_01_FULL_49_25]|uniref:Tellurium resistance protein TerC n=1 Tax=Candidatus Yanofskybacteria bacterium RIFCSPLOWO2_01_FULL_49_25 TaxID=1802701 RepID=A0A1F8GV46_9BACT|nr:MAG: hypothetical protein A3A33_03705 [Candidatus Yanofskybacteria bacterium RIFCSPLOWO2_01_FULL_49_25]